MPPPPTITFFFRPEAARAAVLSSNAKARAAPVSFSTSRRSRVLEARSFSLAAALVFSGSATASSILLGETARRRPDRQAKGKVPRPGKMPDVRGVPEQYAERAARYTLSGTTNGAR